MDKNDRNLIFYSVYLLDNRWKLISNQNLLYKYLKEFWNFRKKNFPFFRSIVFFYRKQEEIGSKMLKH